MSCVRNQLALIKVESTAGTEEACAAADAIELEGIIDPSNDFETVERELVNGGYVDGLPLIISKKASVSLTVRLRGSGTNNVAPKWSRLLQAAGFTVTAGVSDVDITPVPTCATVTMYLYRGANLHKFVGCAFVPENITFDGGWKMSGTLTGKHVAVVAAAQPASPVFDSGQFFSGLAPSISYGGYTGIVRGLSINFGAQLAECMDLNDATGYDRFVVTGFKPTGGTITVEDVAIGTQDWREIAGVVIPTSAEALSFGWGTGAGNILAFSLPNSRLGTPTEGNENALATLEMPISFSDSAAGASDWITITTS